MKQLNFLAASKRYAILGAALEAHGIDPDAEDPKAAIGAALAATAAADPALAIKAEKWDKFSAQATAEGLKAEEIIASESGLKDRVETVARDVLKTHLKENAPTNSEHAESSTSLPAGITDGPTLAKHYQKLVAKGDHAAASAFYAEHSSTFLSHISLTTEG